MVTSTEAPRARCGPRPVVFHGAHAGRIASSFAGSTGLRWSRTYRIGDARTVTVDISDLRLFVLDPTMRERLFAAFNQLAVFDAPPGPGSAFLAGSLGVYGPMGRNLGRRAPPSIPYPRGRPVYRRRITGAVTNPNSAEALHFLEDWLQPAMDEVDTIASRGGISLGIPTGFSQLDELTNGLQMGTLTVVGAHPGVGASTLVLDFARSCAVKHDLETLFLTLETEPMSVVKRLLSAEAKIKLFELLSGRMSDDDWTKLSRRMQEISKAPLIVHRPTDRGISAVVDLVTDLAEHSAADPERTGLRLLVIDSLQLLTARTDMPYETREREVSEVVRRLKALAHDLDIAVVVTSQLSSNPGPRELPRIPALADLRDSGTIAHVADTVILINRPDAWERDHPRGGEADIIVAKHRQGPTATIIAAHQLHLSRFVDMARG